MKTIEATYNAGRWIVMCPIHGTASAVLALDYHSEDPTQSRYYAANGEYICPVCYPTVTAQMQVVQNRRVVTIPDKSARATAYLLARQKDEVYRVAFPPEREEIESILAERPQLMKNWDGRHETTEMLRGENEVLRSIKHGI